jgi:hypothetical protein
MRRFRCQAPFLFLSSATAFTKTGGTIYGNSGDANANTANYQNTPKGHAVCSSLVNMGSTTYIYRDTTLGTSDNISTTDTVTGWNQ